jgi:WD40 repeat protein
MRVFDLRQNKYVWQKNFEESITKFIVDPQGKIVVCGRDSQITLIDLENKKTVWYKKKDLKSFTDIHFSHNNDYVLAINPSMHNFFIPPNEAGYMKVSSYLFALDTENGNLLHNAKKPVFIELGQHLERGYAIDIHPDHGNLVVIAQGSGKISLWDWRLGKKLAQSRRDFTEEDFLSQSDISTTNAQLSTVCRFSPDGKRLFTAVIDGRIMIWEIYQEPFLDEQGKLQSRYTFKDVLILQAHQGEILDMSFDQKGEILVSVGVDGAVKIWDTRRLSNHVMIKIAKSGRFK